MEIINGRITGTDKNGITIFAPYSDIERLTLRKYSEVQIGLPDGRTISPEQRRKAHALINEIAEWIGDLPEFVKRLMKMEFIVNSLQSIEKELFSLSDCDVTTAREFITYLIDFMIEHDVPSKIPLYEQCEDIHRYVYSCALKKRCAISGKRAELHHVDAVGMGRDRDDIIHIGMRVLPLSRELHALAHTKGNDWLLEEYHLEPIKVDRQIAKIYKLNTKERQNESHINIRKL